MDSWAANEKPAGMAKGPHRETLSIARDLSRRSRSFQFRSRDRPCRREREARSEKSKRERERERERRYRYRRKINSALAASGSQSDVATSDTQNVLFCVSDRSISPPFREITKRHYSANGNYTRFERYDRKTDIGRKLDIRYHFR